VDDHPVVREGLRKLINQENDLTACAEAADAQQAMQAIAEHKPDLAIVDVSLGETDGIELIKNIKAHHGELPILVLSIHDESVYAERALRAGARGYIMKHEATGTVVDAIRQVLRGELYMSQKLSNRLLHRIVNARGVAQAYPLEWLTDRELRVFELMGRGLGTRQIASQLHVSVKTVESHRAHIKGKLGLTTGSELLQHAIRWVQSSEGA